MSGYHNAMRDATRTVVSILYRLAMSIKTNVGIEQFISRIVMSSSFDFSLRILLKIVLIVVKIEDKISIETRKEISITIISIILFIYKILYSLNLCDICVKLI